MLSRFVLVIAVGVLAATGLPSESPAASAKGQCIKDTCKAQKKACVTVFRDQSGTSKEACAELKGRERRQCKKAAKGAFREDNKRCKAAYRDCKECCKGDQITACSVAVCGDGIGVAGEECDGLDDSACPAQCQEDCTCLVTTTTTSSATTTTTSSATTTTTVAYGYVIVDVMVEDAPYAVARSSGYTGLQFGVCTEPYVAGSLGTQLQASDVNTGIGGTTTGIWAKYDHVPLNSPDPVLVQIAVKQWPNWNPSCPDGWVPASGAKGGALTTGTKGSCWRNGLCVRYKPLSESDTIITNLSLSHENGSIVPACQTYSGSWPMERDELDIHRGCKDDRYAFVAYNRSPPSPPVPEMPDVNDQEKLTLLETYAPQVRLSAEEIWMPSSVEWAFQYMKRVLREDGRYWLNTKEYMSSPSDWTLWLFRGDLDSAPVYAFWINKDLPIGRTHLDVVDLVYFFFYPYNRGKSVASTIFGSHVGDWEHITVRLTWQYGDTEWALKPSQVYYSVHSFGAPYSWDDSRLQKVGDTHPVVYSAQGSHGSWIDAGRHKYDEACWFGPAVCEDLVDWCGDDGPRWDTWTLMETFEFYPSTDDGRGLGATDEWPLWMGQDFGWQGNCDFGDESPSCGAIWRWGNPKWGEVAGYYRLEDGPTGPVSKSVMRSSELE